MVEEDVPLNRIAHGSNEYTPYTPNTPIMNREPETACSKSRTTIILLSVFAIAAVSAGITIGVTKGKPLTVREKVNIHALQITDDINNHYINPFSKRA